MKLFIKFFILVVSLSFSQHLFAQSFGVKGGFNYSTIYHVFDRSNNMYEEWIEEAVSESEKWQPGFHVGLTADFPLSSMFSIESGAFFTSKGYISKVGDFGMQPTVVNTLKLYYLEIPLNVKGAFDLNERLSLFGTFGPYVGIGLFGNSKFETTVLGITEVLEDSITFGQSREDSNLNRMDYGLNFGTGVEFGLFQLGATYGLGLANIAHIGGDGSVLKRLSNQLFSVSVGMTIL